MLQLDSMPKIFTSETQKVGEIGENVAVKYLLKHGFIVLDRNYTRKWGEIDIVAEKDKKLYFIEVKSATRKLDSLDRVGGPVSQSKNDAYRAEDNMHPWKLKRLSRTIQTYLLSEKVPEDTEWQLDLLVVYLDMNKHQARVKVLPDIVI